MAQAPSVAGTRVARGMSFWEKLTYKPVKKPAQAKMRKRDLASILGMLRMLLENGLSLQKALESLATDRSCRRHHAVLRKLLQHVAAGETLSRAMMAFPKIFTNSITQHVALAESSGTLIESLNRIVEHLEESVELRRKLVNKLSYPALVVFAGSGLVLFMLTTVVPQFEDVYADSQVALPWVTSFVSGLSRIALRYLWVIPLGLISAFLLYRSVRNKESASISFDGWLLRLPMVGPFLKDISALEFLRSALVLSEAGFVPIDAITQAAKCVPNRFVKKKLLQVSAQVSQGKKISAALKDVDYLFPSAVLQLILVGEQTGGLSKSCYGACEIVKKQMENRLTAALGALEPILTISLAACVGWIVLAIYMPMFKMFDVLDIQ